MCYFRPQHEEATRLIDEMKLEIIDVARLVQMSRDGLHVKPFSHRVFSVTSNTSCGF